MQKIDYVAKLLDIASRDESIDSINVRVANYMLSHLKELGYLKNKEIAKECFVDEATISRFVRSLGFLKFGEFTSYFKEYNEIHGIAYYFKKDKLPTSNELVENMISAIKMIDQCILEKDILEVEKLLNKHQEILIGGDRFSQLVAKDLQFKLLSLHIFAKTYADVKLQNDEIKRHQGLFILFSASLNRSKPILEEARKNGWDIILITRNKEASMYGDVCLIYDDEHIGDWTRHSVNDRFCMEMIVDQIILKIASSAIK